MSPFGGVLGFFASTNTRRVEQAKDWHRVKASMHGVGGGAFRYRLLLLTLKLVNTPCTATPWDDARRGEPNICLCLRGLLAANQTSETIRAWMRGVVILYKSENLSGRSSVANERYMAHLESQCAKWPTAQEKPWLIYKTNSSQYHCRARVGHQSKLIWQHNHLIYGQRQRTILDSKAFSRILDHVFIEVSLLLKCK